MEIKDLKIEPLLGFEKITIDEIKNLEQFLNVKLPNDYMNFLLEYNGGFPLYYTCDLMNNKDTVNNNMFMFYGYMPDKP